MLETLRNVAEGLASAARLLEAAAEAEGLEDPLDRPQKVELDIYRRSADDESVMIQQQIKGKKKEGFGDHGKSGLSDRINSFPYSKIQDLRRDCYVHLRYIHLHTSKTFFLSIYN